MTKTKLNISHKYVVYVLYMFLVLLGLWLSFLKSHKLIKVSIIVPVYNTEKYLDSCLKSIENQTLKDIEIICINDGSKDNRIKIINQENSGVSAARNAGIRSAVGEYIAFVDSDDLISPDMCERNYNNSKKYDTDITEFGNITFRDGEEISLERKEIYDESKIIFSSCQNNENPFNKLKIGGSIVWKK